MSRKFIAKHKVDDQQKLILKQHIVGLLLENLGEVRPNELGAQRTC